MQRLYFILSLLLLMSCNEEAIPKEKQTLYYVSLGIMQIKCSELRWSRRGYTLAGCDMNVKEVINATNIIIYE